MYARRLELVRIDGFASLVYWLIFEAVLAALITKTKQSLAVHIALSL
jgi:hypothetical protein